MPAYRHPILIVGVISILHSCRIAVEAGWRPRLLSPSWASSIRTLSSVNQSKTDQSQAERWGCHPSLQHSSSSLFGVGSNVDLNNGQRNRYLASIVSASFRGGSSDVDVDVDIDENQSESEAEEQDDDVSDQVDSSESKQKELVAPIIDSKSKSKTKDDNDDERYSRQMYALGARAHTLIRSNTAILDGPLGGKTKLARSLSDVQVDGADGFDGLNTDSASHGLNGRSETPSGLLYELAKNLALSGVGRIILVQDDEESSGTTNNDSGYFDGSLDDLGAAYHRAALAEISGANTQREKSGEEEGDSDITEENELASSHLNDDGALLLAEYIQRLNPGVQVDILPRSKLLHLLRSDDDVGEDASDDDEKEDEEISLGANPVMVCVDRSISSQLEMNNACRECSSSVPFVSVETAGVHVKLFCDFGPKFIVVDEDGETARSTLLDRVEEVPEEDESSEKLYTINCLEGERHDVSQGDVIEFQGEHSGDDGPMGIGKVTFPKCQVVSVKSPRVFKVKEWDGESTGKAETKSSGTSLSLLLEGKARSFSRVKLPKQISFKSLREILQPSDTANGEPVSTTSIECCNDDALFAPSDLDKSFDPLRRRAVVTCIAALDAFATKYGRLPSRYSKDMKKFQSIVRKISKDNSSSITNEKQWEMLTTQFAQTCRAKFTPVQALSGALGAQEVLKAATGLYNPVKQFLLYDCDEVLQSSVEDNEEEEPEESSERNGVALGQAYILGDKLSNKVSNSRLFLVGAGAIGCELLKNLAAMGAGGASNTKQGCLILTDMDTIEKSNLSRQLLFRDHDVGEFKSVAARGAVSCFSPNCNIETHTSRVGENEEADGPFDDDFWAAGCDVVLNALDNVEARLYVDSKCVSHSLGLIDAGTLGPKGNVQVVVPHLSESYGSSADPPEPDIPVCTLKNFPYEISHTIQWGRDLFDGYFSRRPRQANDHVEEMAQMEDMNSFGRMLIEKLGDDAAVNMAEELGEDLGPFPFVVGNADSNDPEYVMAVKNDALNWATRQAHRLFFTAMDELIQKHPVDSLDDEDAPFWSGTRRAPKPLRFIPLDSKEDEVSAQQVIINERIAQFVRSAARLRMETFLTEAGNGDRGLSSISLEEALIALQEQARKLQAKKKRSTEILHNLSGGSSDDADNDEADALSLITEKLNGAKIGASFLPTLSLADFEKDDESNGHVAFVAAASNLRAMSYGIPPADAMETRRVAGRIVPAMITTTGLVSALSCLELVKLLKGLPLMSHRNAFVNLALPFFAFTAPMPAEEVEGVNGETHTIWDRITIKDKSTTKKMTLGKFLKKVQRKAGCGEDIEIASISYGPYLIYANFLNGHDMELLETPLLDTVKDAVISEDDSDMDDDTALFNEDDAEGDEEKKAPAVELTSEQKTMLNKVDQKIFIDFSVTVEDTETGEEFELPPVRLVKERQTQQEDTTQRSS